jgi:hypothetical protein
MIGNFGLLVLARVLYLIIWPFAVTYQHGKYLAKAIRKRDINVYTNAMAYWYYKQAYSLDQHGNAAFYSILNDLQVHPDGKRFGNEDETLSHVYGVNRNNNKLYPLGLWFAKIIDKVAAKFGDINHLKKAAENEQLHK